MLPPPLPPSPPPPRQTLLRRCPQPFERRFAPLPYPGEAMPFVAFLPAAPPVGRPTACRACACGWRRGTVGSQGPSRWAAAGKVGGSRVEVGSLAAASRSHSRWRMDAGTAGGDGEGSGQGADDAGVELDMELLRQRMEKMAADGESEAADEDGSDEEFEGVEVMEVVVEEVDVSLSNSSDEEDNRGKEDIGERRFADPVSGEVRTGRLSGNQEVASAYKDCNSLYIIVFNAGDSDGEGLYSIHVGGVGAVILAFARMEEAGRYALALKEKKIIEVSSIVDIQVAVRYGCSICTLEGRTCAAESSPHC